MKANISDLVHILKYFNNSQNIEKKYLFFQLNQDTIRVNWIKLYNLGIKLKILNEKKDISKITSEGKVFYSMYSNLFELNSDQKLFIFKNNILNNPSFKAINNFLKLFTINSQDNLEFYKTQKGYEQLRISDTDILFELNIFNFEGKKITIKDEFAEILLHQKLFGKSAQSQSELDKILEEQRRVGEQGEELTLEYEKKYFKQKKWNYQEKNVRIVGKKNIRLGYDVESFLTEKSRLDLYGMGDKHIEVKSRKYDEFSFIISKNELKMGEILSKQKNEQYWIYFWNNLESNPTKPTRIIPFKELKIKTCENCLNYLVKLDRN